MYYDQLKQVIGEKKFLSFEDYNTFLSKDNILGITENKKKDKNSSNIC